MIAIDYELLQSYARGDVPSAPIDISIDSDHDWTGVETSFGSATIDDNTVTLALPELEDAGLIVIAMTVTGAGGKRERLAPLRIVVEDPDDGWNTLASMRVNWTDAPDDDAYLYELMLAARRDCKRFNPAADPGAEDVEPEDATAYRLAEQLQATGRWGASRSTNADRLGDDTTGVTVFPMDWQVKQLLRPQTGIRGMF